MTVRLSPISLPFNYGATASIDLTVNLLGAQSNAESGNVSVSLPIAGAVSQLGPLLFPGPIRNIAPVVGNASITLVGAQALAQAEQLEGADVTVFLDGATAFAEAGSMSVEASEASFISFVSEGDSILFKVETTRIEFHSESTRIQFKSEATRIAISSDTTKTGIN